jgi:hypothetical protein
MEAGSTDDIAFGDPDPHHRENKLNDLVSGFGGLIGTIAPGGNPGVC